MKDISDIELKIINGGGEGCNGCRFGRKFRASWELFKNTGLGQSPEFAIALRIIWS